MHSPANLDLIVTMPLGLTLASAYLSSSNDNRKRTRAIDIRGFFDLFTYLPRIWIAQSQISPLRPRSANPGKSLGNPYMIVEIGNQLNLCFHLGRPIADRIGTAIHCGYLHFDTFDFQNATPLRYKNMYCGFHNFCAKKSTEKLTRDG